MNSERRTFRDDDKIASTKGIFIPVALKNVQKHNAYLAWGSWSDQLDHQFDINRI